MISRVTLQESTYAELPSMLEAGTPNIAGTIGLGAALRWYGDLGPAAAQRYEAELLRHGTSLLDDIDGIELVGRAANKASVLSFVAKPALGVHPFDLADLLDKQGIAVRTGHHCAEPVMDRLGLPGTVRASLSIYNTKQELDALAAALRKALRMLA